MAAPDASGFENLPPIIQWSITLGVGAAVAVAAGWTYVRKLAAPSEAEKKSDLIVTSAQLSDMAPFREQARLMGDLVAEFRACRQRLDDIHGQLAKVEHDREIDREVERRLHIELLEKARQIDVTRPRPRRDV